MSSRTDWLESHQTITNVSSVHIQFYTATLATFCAKDPDNWTFGDKERNANSSAKDTYYQVKIGKMLPAILQNALVSTYNIERLVWNEKKGLSCPSAGGC